MQSTIIQLQNIIKDYRPLLEKINEDNFIYKPLPNKWSRKEELGHLIDSAMSNSRRFVVGQYEDQPYIVYNQDKWVAISDYQSYPTTDLINFWALINGHICQILKNTSEDNSKRMVRTQETHSIEWLAADYNKHLLHHLHHILNLEPVPYP